MFTADVPAMPPVSIRVHSVLFNNAKKDLARSLENLSHAIRYGFKAGLINAAEIALGDCSPEPIFTAAEILQCNERFREFGIDKIDYQFFNANLGSAAGHNRLLKTLCSDFVLILNPDTIVAPNLFVELLKPFSNAGVGIVEARQIPIEHPKDYDAHTGDTSWASTACALVRRAVAGQLNGFDEDTFFLYCDDVDFSWRARLAGHRVIYRPSATVFHDKRLASGAKLITGANEEFYSAEAALLLAHKYSRPALTLQLISDFSNGSVHQKRAVASYQRRLEEKSLPIPIDPEHRVSQFINGAYAHHRF